MPAKKWIAALVVIIVPSMALGVLDRQLLKEEKADQKVDTSKLVPLTDLGTDQYQGFTGGLYPDGKNERPALHEAAGLALAKQVQPLDVDGMPNKQGKIVGRNRRPAKPPL